MQLLRILKWIAITAIVVIFLAMNWTPSERRPDVNLWPLADGNYLHVTMPVGVIALIFFLLGLLPAWLVYRARGWQLNRRIASLENSLRAAAAVSLPDPEPQPDENPETKTEGWDEP